jgi:hypothetical protein
MNASWTTPNTLAVSRATMPTSTPWHWRWHRVKGGWRCRVGIHRWRGYIPASNEGNISPAPHKEALAAGGWRVCTWCGERERSPLSEDSRK